MTIIEQFAGPGGWSTGAALVGAGPAVGYEWDADACRTARAAGHTRIQIDVTEVPDADLAALAPACTGFITSPPCPAWSRAGTGGAAVDWPRIAAHLTAVQAAGQWLDYRDRSEAVFDLFGEAAVDDSAWADPRSGLVLEAVRWALALNPPWIAAEQVSEVMPFWKAWAELLREQGYSVWAGVLSAEQYGVPQTRRRAILLASRERAVHVPTPTHEAYKAGRRPSGPLLPWVSMERALGWPAGQVGFPRQNDREDGAEYRERDFRGTDQPAFTLTEKARSWSRWALRPSVSDEGSRKTPPRAQDEPAHTVTFKHRSAEWQPEAAAPTGKPIARVSIAEAAALQSFPAGYPWHGSDSARFRQIGDAVPPLLAAAALGVVLGREAEAAEVCRAGVQH